MKIKINFLNSFECRLQDGTYVKLGTKPQELVAYLICRQLLQNESLVSYDDLFHDLEKLKSGVKARKIANDTLNHTVSRIKTEIGCDLIDNNRGIGRRVRLEDIESDIAVLVSVCNDPKATLPALRDGVDLWKSSSLAFLKGTQNKAFRNFAAAIEARGESLLQRFIVESIDAENFRADQEFAKMEILLKSLEKILDRKNEKSSFQRHKLAYSKAKAAILERRDAEDAEANADENDADDFLPIYPDVTRFMARDEIVEKDVASKPRRKPASAAKAPANPLNWEGDSLPYYYDEELLWYRNASGEKEYLPQVLLVGPTEDESSIRVQLREPNFQASCFAEAGFDFYQQHCDEAGKKFHDGENARLVEWRPADKILVFEGNCYFDYCKTNLALDAPLTRLEEKTLREHLHPVGRLEPLSMSRLANTTGVNGLVFANDGYMIYQQRLDSVLVRPAQLCSGFSGTVDKIDIEHLVEGSGVLARFDAVREAVEELGIRRKGHIGVVYRRFLAITRELIRGGAPEMFYSTDVNLDHQQILSLIPDDKEGIIQAIDLGDFGRSRLSPDIARDLPEQFDDLLKRVGQGRKISVPFLTNLVFWMAFNCPDSDCFGVGKYGKGKYGEA